MDLSENRLRNITLNAPNLVTFKAESNELKTFPRMLVTRPACELCAESGRLKKILLRDNKIASLPASFGDLASDAALENLDLAYNDLDALPAALCELRSLTKLDLHQNNRMASVSPDVAFLANVELLKLAWNNITKLPDGVGRKTLADGTAATNALRVLELDGNAYFRPSGDLARWV